MGIFYNCIVDDPNPKRCTFNVLETTKEPARNFHVHIAIAPTKSQDRIEWFVEKSVEIGVDIISFIECHNSERTSLKMDRIRKVAISAMKQSVRATLPILNKPVNFDGFINTTTENNRFIAHVDSQNTDHLMNSCPKATTAVILIGPEGDFSDAELQLAIENNFRKVSLGSARLRTETAGLAACHIINLINSP
jgi:16S rRNA (uracil1498-N3)-methyltransferase